MRSLAALALVALVWPFAAAGAVVCDDRAAILEQLAEGYEEGPIAVGVTAGGDLVEILSSSGGKTWTLIVTTPNGLSCALAWGEGWRSLELDPKLRGEPL